MAQVERADGSGTAPGVLTVAPGVLTVAELLSRNIPAPRTSPDEGPRTSLEEEPQPAFVSVGSLLRREGRAPHAIDRPVQPRSGRLAAEVPAVGPATEGGPRRWITRRVTAVAGTLLAAGSVLGAAVLTTPTAHSPGARQGLGGSNPGRALPGSPGTALPAAALPAAALPAAALPAVGELTGPAGTVATPSSWMDVGFPTAMPVSRAAAPDPTSVTRTGGTELGGTASRGSGTSGGAGTLGRTSTPSGAGTSAKAAAPAVTAHSGPVPPVAAPAPSASSTGTAGPTRGSGRLRQPVRVLGGTASSAGTGLARTAQAGADAVQQLGATVTGTTRRVGESLGGAAAGAGRAFADDAVAVGGLLGG